MDLFKQIGEGLACLAQDDDDDYPLAPSSRRGGAARSGGLQVIGDCPSSVCFLPQVLTVVQSICKSISIWLASPSLLS